MPQSPAPRAPARSTVPARLAEAGGRARTVAALAVAAVVLVGASLAIGRFSVPVDVDPTTRSVEAGFARDMQVHHLQAVQLAMIVRDETDDPDVRLLAYDIATAQAQQAGQMHGWLNAWGLPQAPSEPPMTWMTRPPLTGTGAQHGHDPNAEVPATMPGYLDAEQIAELSSASGVDAERLFLELMIEHHKGGVEMAKAVLERSTQRVVVDLASGIVAAQESEIALMTDMLAQRS